MKNKHKERPIRNFFYTVFCIVISLAFVSLWYSLLFPQTAYRNEILIVSASVLIIAVIFGIILPLFKLIKKR